MEKNEDRDRVGDGGRSATDRDVGTVDGTGQPQALMVNVDDALKILVHNATEEFGFAPRDVYDGVFNLPGHHYSEELRLCRAAEPRPNAFCEP